MIENAGKLYDGRRKAVQKGELNLNEFSTTLTDTEKEIINKNLSKKYSFIKSTKSQLVFKKDNEVFKFARFGCDDEVYDGVQVNKKEINMLHKHNSKSIFLSPEELSQYVYKIKYIEPITNLDLPEFKKESAFNYVIDILDEIDEIKAFDLKRSQVGYDVEKDNIYVIDYENLIK